MTWHRRLTCFALAAAALTQVAVAQDKRPAPPTPREPSYEAWIDRCKQYQDRYEQQCRQNKKPDEKECALLMKYIGAYCPI